MTFKKGTLKRPCLTLSPGFPRLTAVRWFPAWRPGQQGTEICGNTESAFTVASRSNTAF